MTAAEQLTTEQKVDRLWGVHEIRQLAYDYAWGIDACDVDLLRSLWTDTSTPAEMPVMDGHYVRGPGFDRWLGEGPTILFVGNHRIAFSDDDHATGSVYCMVQMEVEGRFVDQTILYQDSYERVAGRWLFVSRRHMLWFGEERDRNPFEQAPADWPERVHGNGTLPDELPTYRRYKERAGS